MTGFPFRSAGVLTAARAGASSSRRRQLGARGCRLQQCAGIECRHHLSGCTPQAGRARPGPGQEGGPLPAGRPADRPRQVAGQARLRVQLRARSAAIKCPMCDLVHDRPARSSSPCFMAGQQLSHELHDACSVFRALAHTRLCGPRLPRLRRHRLLSTRAQGLLHACSCQQHE